jgi:TonB-linked SusC/RagA family outer membrane protein
MNVNQKTNRFFSKSLFKLAACTLLTTGISIGQAWAASGSMTETRSAAVQQETGTIKGRVVDEKGEGLVGVNIKEKGTSNGTISNSDGSYTLNVKGQKPVLVFSYIGYSSQEILVGNSKAIQVTLKENSKLVDEVVVIGYGTQRKGDVTSAVTSVKAEDFTKGFIRDASDLVKGKVAGLNISNGSGDPSSKATIMLRGVASLYGGTDPLILVDGVAGGLTTVAPEDIESIDVLKDASAAAIYGTRGANGVILITTKSGKRNMKPEVTFTSYLAASSFGKKADFLNASDVRSLLAQGVKLPFTDEGATTNWLDEITRTALSQNYNVSLRGGQESSNYSANLSYINKDGVFNRTNDNQLKATVDLNQYFLKDLFKINFNVLKGIENTNALGSSSSFNPNTYRQALIRNPTAPIKDANGKWVETSRFQYYNPVAQIEETDGKMKSEYTRLTSNLTVRPFAGFEGNVMLSTRSVNGMNDYYETQNNYSTTVSGKNGIASKNAKNERTDEMEITAKYNKTLGLHKISALAGYSYNYNVNESFYANNYNFPSDNYTYNNLQQGYALKDGKADMGSDKNDNKLIGFFGRVSYGYDDRYNILASVRREGSSKFGANNKWATFPSVSLGWNINKEEFMKEMTFIDNLKLRAGYGVTGVIPSDSYQSQTLYKYDPYGYFDNNGTWVKGLVPASNPNPNLKWEKSAEFNVGLDFGLLKNRISGSIDVYSKKTTDLLWQYNVPTPPNLYNITLANVGSLRNQGIEIALNAIPVQTKDFEWKTTVTLSHNENKLLSLSNDLYDIKGNFINIGNAGDPISMSTHRLEVGQSLGNFWGLKSVGITYKGDKFGTDGSASKPEGKWVIQKPNGDEVVLNETMYNDNNKQYLGNGIPKFNMGWTNTFRYKRFDLSMVFNGAFGFKILNFQRMFYENPNINYNMLKSAFDKVYGKAILNYPQTFVSYYIENGDYIKLDNVTLGYSLNVKKIKFLRDLRVYASGQNLLCITGYKGLDPEIANTLEGGMKVAGDDSRDKFPSTRTITLGINVTF